MYLPKASRARRPVLDFFESQYLTLPQLGKNTLYQALLKQVENQDIPVVKSIPAFQAALDEADLVLDALFGA